MRSQKAHVDARVFVHEGTVGLLQPHRQRVLCSLCPNTRRSRVRCEEAEDFRKSHYCRRALATNVRNKYLVGHVAAVLAVDDDAADDDRAHEVHL